MVAWDFPNFPQSCWVEFSTLLWSQGHHPHLLRKGTNIGAQGWKMEKGLQIGPWRLLVPAWILQQPPPSGPSLPYHKEAALNPGASQSIHHSIFSDRD
jgi:hypothetical protein